MDQDNSTIRKAFLCELYKRTQGNATKSAPYQHIVDGLNHVEEGALEQAYHYLVGIKFITTFTIHFASPVTRLHASTIHDYTRPHAPSMPEKFVTLTDDGVAYVQEHCSADVASV